MGMFELGQHVARVKSFELGRSSEKKTPCVQLLFEFLEGPNAGKEISAWRYFTGDATEHSLKALRVCGWSGEKLSEDMPGLGSAKVRITLEPDTDPKTGNVRTKVSWINSLTSAPVLKDRSDDADISKLNASLVNHLKRSEKIPVSDDAVIKGGQATRVEAVGTAADDEDIPF